jgi:hypothetical protein
VSGAGKAAVAGGAGELGRARLHAGRAVAELTAALQAWGLWADSVRQRAEQRLGVTDLDDQRVLSDLEYGQALDAGGVFAAALRAARAAGSAGGPDLPGAHK